MSSCATCIEEDSGISAIPENRGAFVQNTIASFTLRVVNFNGIAVDPESITVRITDSSDVEVELDNAIPEKIGLGFYIYEWTIPVDQTIGKYTIRWAYTIDDVEKYSYQNFTVVADGKDSKYYTGRIGDMREMLEILLGCAQNIPVYNEQGIPTADCTKYKFTFPRWNQTSGLKIYRNKTVINKGAIVNYERGELEFVKPLTQYDIITASYNFRWFDDNSLNSFIQNAINVYNHYPPFLPSYDINTLPDGATSGVLYKAAADAIREMIMCLMFQEPQKIFGGREAADKIRGDLETLKKNYEEDWKLIFGNKKFRPYPTTRAVVLPALSLPGGRSRWFRYLYSSGAE